MEHIVCISFLFMIYIFFIVIVHLLLYLLFTLNGKCLFVIYTAILILIWIKKKEKQIYYQ